MKISNEQQGVDLDLHASQRSEVLIIRSVTRVREQAYRIVLENKLKLLQSLIEDPHHCLIRAVQLEVLL